MDRLKMIRTKTEQMNGHRNPQHVFDTSFIFLGDHRLTKKRINIMFFFCCFFRFIVNFFFSRINLNMQLYIRNGKHNMLIKYALLVSLKDKCEALLSS